MPEPDSTLVVDGITEHALDTVPAEDRDVVLRWAAARWGRYNPLVVPRWNDMTNGDRASAVVEAHHWLRAAREIGLVR